jgi:hypothetical protein
MGAMGRPYGKNEEQFNDSEFFKFFYALNKHFKSTLKFNDKQTMDFIKICSMLQGPSFSPWKLNSQEYYDSFLSWYKINATKDTYIANVKDSIKNVIKFCKQKNITNLEYYIKNWGVTHYISKVLNDNVAYALGLHEIPLSKPEKFMIRAFLKNVPMIKERISREGRLKTILDTDIKQAKEMLIWNSEQV